MLVCISASMKYKDDIKRISALLDDLQINYLLPEMDISREQENELPELTPKLVYEHFEKIDRADAVLVINPGGYIGNSVKIEIGYARGSGKKVFFLKETGHPEIDCLAEEILSENKLSQLK